VREELSHQLIDREVTLFAPLTSTQFVLARAADHLRRALSPEKGQGTVEYVALVTLVALVMVGVIAALKSAQFAEGQELGAMILRKITEAVSKVKY
jgi:Flp pilus assembly pilin Flp